MMGVKYFVKAECGPSSISKTVRHAVSAASRTDKPVTCTISLKLWKCVKLFVLLSVAPS